MLRKKIDSLMEQKIVIGMVISKEFLAQGISAIDISLIQSDHLRLIARWVIQYWERYGEPPKENIESIYHAWVRKGKAPDEMVESVSDALELLSSEYEKEGDLNIPYLLDSSSEYFNNRRLQALKDELEYSLSEGDQKGASEAVSKFSMVSARLDHGIDPLNNPEAWDSAFSASQEPLISWKNPAADHFFGSAMIRDGLIGILAPEKRGKTWWCVELSIRALMQRKRIALFEVGDMSQSQIMRRIGVRLSRRPMYRKDLGEIKIPKEIRKEEGEVFVKYLIEDHDRIVTASSSKKGVERFLRGHGIASGDPHFKVSVHANSAINVRDISSILNQWEAYEGFIPDVIIIDYPDILAPEPGCSGMSSRDQINVTWKALRRLSQERHCLVIAPTQADAASYNQETLDANNFSEDKRKLAHVTGMLGLNQTREEKAQGIMRLNWIALREGDFSPDYCLYVGICFRLGRSFTCASLGR